VGASICFKYGTVLLGKKIFCEFIYDYEHILISCHSLHIIYGDSIGSLKALLENVYKSQFCWLYSWVKTAVTLHNSF